MEYHLCSIVIVSWLVDCLECHDDTLVRVIAVGSHQLILENDQLDWIIIWSCVTAVWEISRFVWVILKLEKVKPRVGGTGHSDTWPLPSDLFIPLDFSISTVFDPIDCSLSELRAKKSWNFANCLHLKTTHLAMENSKTVSYAHNCWQTRYRLPLQLII